MSSMTILGRGLVEGTCRSKLIVLERLNVYGDIDPATGLHRILRISLKGAIVAAKAMVGSTVAPYIAYAMRRRGVAPCGIVIASKLDPLAVATAILGRIALVEVDHNVYHALARAGGCQATVVSRPPQAKITITCLA